MATTAAATAPTMIPVPDLAAIKTKQLSLIHI